MPPRVVICPYCGRTQRPGSTCLACGGRLSVEARDAAAARLGPWFVRDEDRPFLPGASLEEVRRRIAAGEIGKWTIVRGPTTRQFWTVARHVPGISHLLGYCHRCDGPAVPEEHRCRHCRADFSAPEDRDSLGLAPDDDGDEEALRSRESRLSAFASDEELREGLPMAGSGRTAAPVLSIARTREGPAADSLVLASQQRLRRSSIRRRRLWIAWLAVIAAASGFAALLVLRGGGGTPGATEVPPRAPSVGETPGEAPPLPETPSVAPPAREAAQPPSPPPPTEPQARLAAIAAEVEGLAASTAPIDERRALAESLAARLADLAQVPGVDQDARAAIATRIEAIRAQIELEAALGRDLGFRIQDSGLRTRS